MKDHAEPLMNEDDHDRIRPSPSGKSNQKYLLRWALVVFSLAVWFVMAALLIW
ncbi:hypothetical protein [Rhizobium sp. BR 314]|uniref:hypothetical protein n=1 Tax=Rhizobium sp. BR 314 TaxID=3040013 RepID=UPI0039BF431F